MKTMKKFFAGLLVLCMVLTLPNITASAAEGTGTEENPEVITTLGETTTTIAEGTDQSFYYYSYTAPTDLEGSAIMTLTVTSVTEGVYYGINFDNIDSGAYGQILYNTNFGADVTTGTVKVAAGETVVIKVYNMNTDGAFPAVEVKWNASVALAGTADSPEKIASLYNHGQLGITTETALVPGTDYYYSYTMESTGKFVAYINANWSSLPEEELKGEISITNKTTNETILLSTSEDVYVEQSFFGSVTYAAIKIAAEAGDELVIKVSSAATAEKVVVVWNSTMEVESNPGTSAQDPVEVPETVVDTPFTVTVPAGTEYYLLFPYELEGAIVKVTAPVGAEGAYDMTIGGVYADKDDNGVASGKLVYFNQMGGVMITIINHHPMQEMELSISVDVPVGASGNPEKIEFEEGKTNATVDVDLTENDTYYFLTWVAPATGYLQFGITSSVENAWSYSVSTDNYDVYDYANSAANEPGVKPNPESIIYVAEGNTVTIMVQALKYTEENPANVAAKLTLALELLSIEEGADLDVIDTIENHVVWDEADPNPVFVTVVDAEGNVVGKLSAEVLEALKENGYNLQLTLTDTIYWIIDGSSVTDAKDVDLTVKEEVAIPEGLIEAIVGENDHYTISIAHNGAFGFDAKLNLYVGDWETNYTGMYANLFYYNAETGSIEFQAAYEMESANDIIFNMTHASDYVIVMTEDAMSAEDNIVPEVPEVPENPENPDDDVIEETGDFSSTMIYVIVLLGAALVSAGFVAKKRFA